jgi:hypothetical protein
MLRNVSLVVIVGVLSWCAGRVGADEAYIIKIKEVNKGDEFLVDRRETEQTHVQVLDPDGKALQDKEDKNSTTFVFRETVLDKPEGQGRATRLRRHYEKAQVTKNEVFQALPYQGKTLLIERKDGKYRFQIEGGEVLTGKDAEALDEEFTKDNDREEREFMKALFPSKAVRVNDSWKFDPQLILKSLEKELKGEVAVETAKPLAMGKLLKAYKKDGQQFGVFEFRLELPLKGKLPLDKDNKAVLQPGARLTTVVKADICINDKSLTGSDEMSRRFEATALFKAPDNKEYKLIITTRSVLKTATRELPKK